jgi:hypothetical protein
MNFLGNNKLQELDHPRAVCRSEAQSLLSCLEDTRLGHFVELLSTLIVVFRG